MGGMSTPARLRWPYPHIVPGMFAHRNGQWAKKIRGRMRYFGVVTDPETALRRYQAESPALHSGAVPAGVDAGNDLQTVLNTWLTWQKRRVDVGELAASTYRDDRMVAEWLGQTAGWETPIVELTPARWSGLRASLGEKYKTPTTVRKFVVLVRQAMNWAAAARLIGAVEFGQEWAAPPQRVIRLHQSRRRAETPRLLTAEQIRQLLAAAPTESLRAMILLGINCGFGQTDCSELRIEELQGSGVGVRGSEKNPPYGMISGVRNKTGAERTCVLWPVTAAALRNVIGKRTSGPVFVTRSGRSFVRMRRKSDGKLTAIDSVALMLRKAATASGVRGATFYSLRRTFRTVADSLRDQRAIDRVMGHVGSGSGGDWVPSMISGAYVETVELERLRRVSEHVRSWLGEVPSTPLNAAAARTKHTPRPRPRK